MKPLVYLDANPIIYLIEGTPPISSMLVTMFEAFRSKSGLAVTSELTLAEVLAPTIHRGRIPPHFRRAYLNLILGGEFVSLEPVSRAILMETADVRLARRLKLPDAIHLATAIRKGCKFFVTNDDRLRTPRGMTKVAPDLAGVKRIVRAIT